MWFRVYIHGFIFSTSDSKQLTIASSIVLQLAIDFHSSDSFFLRISQGILFVHSVWRFAADVYGPDFSGVISRDSSILKSHNVHLFWLRSHRQWEGNMKGLELVYTIHRGCFGATGTAFFNRALNAQTACWIRLSTLICHERHWYCILVFIFIFTIISLLDSNTASASKDWSTYYFH